MDAMGLKVHSHFQYYVGMRRVDMVDARTSCQEKNVTLFVSLYCAATPLSSL